MDELVAQQQALSKPAYDKVRDVVIDDPEVLSLFDHPKFRFAHKAVAEAESIRLTGMKIPPLSSKHPVVEGFARVQNPPTIGTLDKMRQATSPAGNSRVSGLTATPRARCWSVFDAATERLDELHLAYAEARAGYAGRARLIDAHEAGKAEFLKLDPREIRAKLAKMPEAEADLYRRGL